MDGEFKGVVKVDFKEAREKSGVSKQMAEQIFKEVSYSDISLDDVESGSAKINEQQVNSGISPKAKELVSVAINNKEWIKIKLNPILNPPIISGVPLSSLLSIFLT